MAPFTFPHLIGLNDVRMVESRSQARFITEHRQELAGAGQLRVKNFEDEEFRETCRTVASCKIDISHATASELSDDSVAIENVVRHWISFKRTIAPRPTISAKREGQVTRR